VDGSLASYDGLLQDVTDLRVLEDELAQAQKLQSIVGSPEGSRTTSTTC